MILSDEQQLFIQTAKAGKNVLVEACIGSGKTTAIQHLCDELPGKKILYLTYNKLLKEDARGKIKNPNVLVTNYHGFACLFSSKAGYRFGITEVISGLVKYKIDIPAYDILIIDEYQDIELDFAEMLEYIKSKNPAMQIIMVGDMSQKIYDKTTLNVYDFAHKFLGDHCDMEFTQCFRLNAELAAKLGRIWEKDIRGINENCKVIIMTKEQVIEYLKKQEPSDVLCLGAKTGPMADVLNTLEDDMPSKYNKHTVYASINESRGATKPDETTAIFTTFDGSKGMEKPVCCVFDWDESYWTVRSQKPNTDTSILRNIFCVAASRGKREIIFVKTVKKDGTVPFVSEKTLKTNLEITQLTNCFIENMFDFKYIEEIKRAYAMLEIIENKETDERIININEADGLIDLSPCIELYQQTIFFDNFDIEAALDEAFEIRRISRQDTRLLSPEQKILKVIALHTNQNRYYNQVMLPLATPEQRDAIITRLLTKFKKNERVQRPCNLVLKGPTARNQSIAVKGNADVVQPNRVCKICFTHAVRYEDFLQLAMYMICFDKPEGMLWNVRDNKSYTVYLPKEKYKAFKKQVYRIITKQK